MNIAASRGKTNKPKGSDRLSKTFQREFTQRFRMDDLIGDIGNTPALSFSR